jgi:subtilisin family serine protease
MGRRIAALLALLCIALTAALAPAASSAGRSSIDPPPLFFGAPAEPIILTEPGAGSQQLAVMVELSAPPALAAPAQADIRAHSRSILAAQAGLQHSLAALGAQVLFQTSLVYNGIAVSIDAGQIEQLRRLPGVAGVHVIPPKQRANVDAVPFVGAPAVWGAPNGATGRGIRVGVVDSGIDYTHADFGGPGTPAAYAANNRTIIEPNTFPTAKVIGGVDLAGDDYDATSSDPAKRIPHADPDPLDCMGHGTHVAGTLAGFGVAADGTTYRGPYTSSLNVSSFRVGPGVAPEAQLYALKVFGCTSDKTALLTLAIERALDPNRDGDPSDHLDVLNLSTGSPFGSNDDPDAVAANNAVRAGMVVVAAAGNTGNTFYAADSPASAQLAIAVGASFDTAHATPPLTPTDSLAPFSARGPQRGNSAIKPDLVAPAVGIRSAAVGSGTSALPMSGTSFAAPQVAGAAALLLQLHPNWKPELVKAALINTAAPVRMVGGAQYPPSLAGAGRLDLRTFTALDLLAYVDDSPDTIALMYGAPWLSQPWTATRPLRLDNRGDTSRIVTLSATTVVSESGVVVQLPPGPFSIAPHSTLTVPVSVTVDPRLLDFTPDAATPAMQDGFPRYLMAEHGGYVQIHSSVPSSVRVRPAHAAHFGDVDFYLDDQLLDDSLDSREVDDYSDTTAGHHTVRILEPNAAPDSQPIFEAPVDLADGHDYTLIMVGRPDALGLVVADETATAPPPAGQALIHFVNANRSEPNWDIGPLDVCIDGVKRVTALPVGQTSPYIALAPGTHTVAFSRAGREVAHKTFEVSAGELLLVGSGRHDDDDSDMFDLEQRVFIGRAQYRATPPQALALRVPFEIFPKAAAEARAANPAITIPPGGHTFSLGLRNTGARNTGLNSSGVGGPQTPLASAFELAATSPTVPGLSESLRGADLKYVGVTNNFSVTQQITNSTVFFGLASHVPWSTPNEIQFQVYIDSNLDGVDDYIVLNTTAVPARPSDAFLSSICRILPNGTCTVVSRSFWDTWPPAASPSGFGLDAAPFNTSVMFQAVGTRQLGLTPSQTRIRYHVETRARAADGFTRLVDRVPAAGSIEYDVAHPALAPISAAPGLTRGRPLFLDVNGGQISGAADPLLLATRHGQDLLILHHHNLPAQQAEVVTVRSTSSTLPLSRRARVMLPMIAVP